ncbi:helix-hairpin-helix domain-containing protein, partial [Ligilactobacillus animalis]
LLRQDGERIGLDPKSEGFYLLQRIQDEVHRFAVTFHRQVRSKNSLSFKLERIPGVGPKTRIKLLRNYGSLKKIAQASLEELQALGISKKVAQTIKLSLDN